MDGFMKMIMMQRAASSWEDHVDGKRIHTGWVSDAQCFETLIDDIVWRGSRCEDVGGTSLATAVGTATPHAAKVHQAIVNYCREKGFNWIDDGDYDWIPEESVKEAPEEETPEEVVMNDGSKA
jgi:hypothetical protein